MARIILEVDSTKVKTVLTILKNLKVGLIKKIQLEEKSKVANDDFMDIKPSHSKYISKDEFKHRLKKRD